MDALKVTLVDDNEAFRKALKSLLIHEFNAEIIGEASNAEEFNNIKNLYLSNIILMDIMLPGIDGVELTKKTLWKNHHLKIIAITMHVDKVYLKTLMEAGFCGCIYKNNLFNELRSAIDICLSGGLYFDDDIKVE